MAKEKKESSEEGKELGENKKLGVGKPSVDFPVTVIATKADPYHVTGSEFEAGCKKALELVERGWVELSDSANKRIKELKELGLLSVVVLTFMLMSFGVNAQTSVDKPLYNATNTYTLARLNAATATRDTVTSTATGFLTSKRTSGPGVVTIQVLVTKVSGTVGGTITIMGSLDGTNFEAMATQETRTALATQTAADATASYSWRLSGSPFLYYRVSYTGGSGAVAYLDARIMKH